MKITIPSPPGLPGLGSQSVRKRGFQLLTTHTFPAWSIWQLVARMNGV